MAIHIVRLGSPREPGEGIRLGTVRRPPRGVPKAEFAKRDFYDVWLPVLSPSAPLVKQALGGASDKDWTAFVKKFRKEMAAPAPKEVLDLLAVLSHGTDVTLGCYCEEEPRCHRSVLRALLLERAAKVV
jgi:uncharacterized protein YeaO (DUF488 family)